MKRFLICLLGTLCLVGGINLHPATLSVSAAPSASSSSGQTEAQFLSANRHYAEGHYEEAAAHYEKMIRSGTSSGPLYYNLGNAYFKLGRLGKSVLNYERARRLIPQDEDLLANLSFVESLLEQEQPREKRRWYEWVMVTLRDLFSATRWAICLLVVYSLLFSTLILVIFVERIRKTASSFIWIFAPLTILSLVFSSAKIVAMEKNPEGVIVQRVVDVRYSPSSKGAVAFQLREGIRAEVNRCEGEWCHIRLTRDRSGWVERQAIEEI